MWPSCRNTLPPTPVYEQATSTSDEFLCMLSKRLWNSEHGNCCVKLITRCYEYYNSVIIIVFFFRIVSTGQHSAEAAKFCICVRDSIDANCCHIACHPVLDISWSCLPSPAKCFCKFLKSTKIGPEDGVHRRHRNASGNVIPRVKKKLV